MSMLSTINSPAFCQGCQIISLTKLRKIRDSSSQLVYTFFLKRYLSLSSYNLVKSRYFGLAWSHDIYTSDLLQNKLHPKCFRQTLLLIINWKELLRTAAVLRRCGVKVCMLG